MSKLDLIRRGVNGRYITRGNPTDASCVIALSFGYRENAMGEIEPGLSNESLARAIDEGYPDKPVIAQYEVSEAMMARSPGRKADFVIGSMDLFRAGQYLNTHDVLAQSLSIMTSRRWTNAILVAHAFHVPRVDAVASALGIGGVIPDGLPEVWDKESQQSWTRSRWQWRLREPLTIAVFALRGWLQ